MPVYKFVRYSKDEITIEADTEDIEQARVLAIDAPEYEWDRDTNPIIDDGELVRS